MLNRDLVAQFKTIAADRETGNLMVHFAATKLRFHFQEGELQLLDLGENKEHLMARKFLDYHMIGQEIHRHVVDVAKKSGISPVDALRRQSLVSDSEIEQIARTLVEDLLCACFGTRHHEMTFGAGDDSSFDLDSSALRLRIDTETLLSMVQARATEEERVIQETGGWDAVYALEEAVDAGDDLDDYERHVLGRIDGKRTIEDLAKTLRTSSMHMARTIVALHAKGYLRRADPTLSGRRASGVARPATTRTPSGGAGVIAAGAATATATPPATATIITDPQTQPAPSPGFVLTPAPRGPSRAPLVVLVSVLLAMIGVYLLVRAGGARRAAVAEVETAFAADLQLGDFRHAQERVAQAGEHAGGDIALKEQAADLAKRLDDAIARELKRVGGLIDQAEFTASRAALEKLPDERVPADLRARIAAAEAEHARNAQGVADRVDAALKADKVAEALAAADAVAGHDGDAARDVLDRWRVISLEQAALAGTPPERRERLVELVGASRPNDREREQVTRIAEDLKRTYGRQKEQVAALAARVDDGAWREALAEGERLRLFDGGGRTPEARALKARIEALRKKLEGACDAAVATLRDSDDAAAFVAAHAALDEAFATLPQASDRATQQGLGLALDAVHALVGQGTLAEESSRLRALTIENKLEGVVAGAVAARVDRLAQVDGEARSALEFARRLAGDGKWDDAIEALEGLRRRADWRRAAAFDEAAQDLTSARASRTRSDANQKRFEAAIAKGDLATAYELARELGMRTLPLSVESVPRGADVVRDGAVVGKTPLLLQIAAAERGELALEIRAAGYEPCTVLGRDAAAGWRIAVELQRAPTAQVDARMIVSARPAAADGALWITGPTQVARIAADGKLTSYPLEASGFSAGAGGRRLAEPVYAPAMALDDGIYVATRDLIALRIAAKGVERVPTGARCDVGLAVYQSADVVNRRWLIVAGTDGQVRALDPRAPDAAWRGPSGAACAVAPVVVGDLALLARVDGSLQALEADNGRVAGEASLGEPVLAAWPDGDGIAGVSRTRAWRWTPAGGVVATALPKEAVAAERDVFVSGDRHAWVRAGETWSDVGVAAAAATAPPLAWRGRAVVVVGKAAHVLGDGGFVVRSESDFLAPVAIGDRLALVSVDGRVSLYAP